MSYGSLGERGVWGRMHTCIRMAESLCCPPETIATLLIVYSPKPRDFPGSSDGKASACNAGDSGSILGWEDILEKEMATHSSILAWKIAWTEELGRLQSVGSQRIGHD